MIPLPPRPRILGFLAHRPSKAPAWLVSALAIALTGFLNLGVMSGKSAGIAYALPLLLCLWTRDALLLYVMALCGSGLSFYKTVMTNAMGVDAGYAARVETWCFQLLNIWVPALAIHVAIYTLVRLDLKRKLLLEANDELNDVNSELALREAEALQHNQALQSLAEELEGQRAQLHTTNEELIRREREAEDAFIQKTRFMAAVSHDVRTPANAISLMAELIEQSAAHAADPANESARADLAVLARDLKANARSLVELVSDVLDLSRLDSGMRDLQSSTFSLYSLLKNEFRQFQRTAAEKQLRFTLHPMEPPIHLSTDRMKLARVIANLLGNAIKFTEAGAVDIRVDKPADGSVVIRISDTGVGIPADALPRIFDEFYQLQNPERDRNKGSGLGLAICKRLVDALGCQMSVDSTAGVGTTFAIAIPRELISTALSDPAALALESRESGDQSLRQVKILLVEDHDVTRRAAARLLAAAGAMVLEARNGREAIHHIVHDLPHVLLLDLMLPDADGTDILKHLRLQRHPSLRCVLAVSGDVRDVRIAEVKELGADDLLAKPLDIDKLLFAITSRLAQKPAVEHSSP